MSGAESIWSPWLRAALIAGIGLAVSGVWVGLSCLLKHIAAKAKARAAGIFASAFTGPLFWLLVFCSAYFALAQLPFAAGFFGSAFSRQLLRSVIIAVLGLGLIRSRGIVELALRKPRTRAAQKTTQTLRLFFTRLYAVLVAVIMVCMILSEFGFNITGILTGLGLGSLTLALAAQDIAGNFFAGLTIILERPFEVGDWITSDAGEGTVEDISFRTTKIRTLDNALTVVPNSKLAGSAVTNWTRLKMRLGNFTLGLTYSTPKKTVQKVLADIEAMLRSHPQVRADTVQVRLSGFASSSIDLLVFFYTQTADIKEYRQIKEDINLRIMDIMAKNKAQFAFPSRSLYIEQAAVPTQATAPAKAD